MGYLHIGNLYKERDILLFKECFALEKIHGTSAHVSFETITTFEFGKDEPVSSRVDLHFFNGGENRERFLALFNQEELKSKFSALQIKNKMTVYGEAYGGKQQGMSHTYGKELKFVAFDVQIGESWLDVPRADAIVKGLGLEFVHYAKVPATIEALDVERDAPSIQAVRNGIVESKPREGIVIRPLLEVVKNNGARIIAKHKGEAFQETNKARKVLDPAQLEVLTQADAIATEWVTPMRLAHILGKRENVQVEQTGEIIGEMREDIKREAAGEIVWSDLVGKAIGKATAKLLHEHFMGGLKGSYRK